MKSPSFKAVLLSIGGRPCCRDSAKSRWDRSKLVLPESCSLHGRAWRAV